MCSFLVNVPLLGLFSTRADELKRTSIGGTMQPVLFIQIPDSLRQVPALSAVLLVFLHLAVLLECLGVADDTHIWAFLVSV